MFSLRSDLKISISWCESIPNSTLSAPTSLAKPTLSAWNALSTYLAASATRIGTRKIRSAGSPYISAIGIAARVRRAAPMTVFSGVSKSATPVPSRRYSGLMATPKSRPGLRDPSSPRAPG